MWSSYANLVHEPNFNLIYSKPKFILGPPKMMAAVINIAQILTCHVMVHFMHLHVVCLNKIASHVLVYRD